MKVFSKVLLAVFLISNSAVAEDQKELKEPLQAAKNFDFSSDSQRIKAESLQLKLKLLKTSAKLGNNEHLDEIALHYEMLTEIFCMPQLYKTLEYHGNPQNELCLNYLSELEKTLPQSPVIPCVKNGIDADECLTAYAEQPVIAVDITNFTSKEVPLLKNLNNLESEQSLKKLRANLSTTITNYQRHLDIYTKNKRKDRNALERIRSENLEISKLYNDLIKQSCQVNTIRILHQELSEEEILTPEWVKNKQKELVSIQDIMQKIDDLSSGKATTKTPEPTPTPTAAPNSWRVRVLNRECYADIVAAYKFSHTIPAIDCYYYGEYTPQCIKSWRNLKKAVRNIKSTTNTKVAQKHKDIQSSKNENSTFSTF